MFDRIRHVTDVFSRDHDVKQTAGLSPKTETQAADVITRRERLAALDVRSGKLIFPNGREDDVHLAHVEINSNPRRRAAALAPLETSPY